MAWVFYGRGGVRLRSTMTRAPMWLEFWLNPYRVREEITLLHHSSSETFNKSAKR